jgi:transcriptional regulator with XRE-family HTH domain
LSKDATNQADTPEDYNLGAVSKALTDRIDELGLTAAQICKRAGMSETTIHKIIQMKGPASKSTLALLSLMLGWQESHLHNIMLGKPNENAVPASPLEENLAQLARGLADIDTLRVDVSELKQIVHRIDGKIDVVIAIRHDSPGEGIGP